MAVPSGNLGDLLVTDRTEAVLLFPQVTEPAPPFQSGLHIQFTSAVFTNQLKAADIRISWDGRGRALDNIFVERLWRSVKYEEVYIKEYQSVLDAVSNLRAYFTFYNHERLHQALDYHTPAQVYTSR